MIIKKERNEDAKRQVQLLFRGIPGFLEIREKKKKRKRLLRYARSRNFTIAFGETGLRINSRETGVDLRTFAQKTRCSGRVSAEHQASSERMKLS